MSNEDQMTPPEKPSPGSDEAAKLGCTCARMDNGYGRGCGYRDENGKPLFWITDGCPLHTAKKSS